MTATALTTRERILAAAATVLTRKGYATMRLADVAALADLCSPAVYHYFDSRDALVTEVMVTGQRWLREAAETSLAALPVGAGVRERIDCVVATHLRVELALSEFASAVTRNSSHLPERIRVALAQESLAYHRIWRQLITDCADVGELRTGLDSGTIRMLVVGALNWAAEWYRADVDQIDDVVRTAQTMIRHALVADEA